jgi:cell division protein FtsQ
LPEDRSPRRRFEKKPRPRPVARGGGRWRLLLVLLPILLLPSVAYATVHFSLFEVRDVDVQGAQSLDSAALVQISGLRGASMLRPPFARARESLLALPQVRSVSFERRWPDGIVIRVEEREPFAFWSVAGRDFVVDRDGYVLAVGAPSGPAPRVVEPDASRIMGPGDRVHPDALALADRIFRESPKVIGQGVRQLEYRPATGVIAVLEGGLRVTFGDGRAYEYKLAVLTELLGDLQSRGVRPRAVDLRFGERVSYE